MHVHSYARTVLLALAALLAGCGSSSSPGTTSTTSSSELPRGDEQVTLKPSSFSTTITNPHWTMAPGDRWVYRETDDEGADRRITVTVLDQTKVVDGVTTRVVHDVATEGGKTVEDTYDWYAQDSAGNVWYFGEDTTGFDKGTASKAGSWEAGVDGAQPGVVMPAHPTAGQSYREEYQKGEAEDQARILSTDDLVEVPQGAYSHAVLTRNHTPLEPDTLEYKWYAPGVGDVMELTTSGGSDRAMLLSYRRG